MYSSPSQTKSAAYDVTYSPSIVHVYLRLSAQPCVFTSARARTHRPVPGCLCTSVPSSSAAASCHSVFNLIQSHFNSIYLQTRNKRQTKRSNNKRTFRRRYCSLSRIKFSLSTLVYCFIENNRTFRVSCIFVQSVEKNAPKIKIERKKKN